MGYRFLSYAREDYDAVCRVYTALRKAGLDPWMDRPPAPWEAEGIPFGVLWESYIKTKIEGAELVLSFLSSVSVTKTGYVQKELKYALACVALRPPGQRFLVPIRLDDCEIPDVVVETIQLRGLQRFDLFHYGIEVLLKGLSKQKPDEPTANPGLLRAMLEEETSRSSTSDRRIAELEGELAYAREQIPPAEVWYDEHFREWWLSQRYRR